MGRGEQTMSSQFVHLLGTRRGGMKKEQDERDLKDTLHYQSTLIQYVPRVRNGPQLISELYDLEGIYKAGVIPRSALYGEFVRNLEKSIVHLGRDFTEKYIVSGGDVHDVTELFLATDDEWKSKQGQAVLQAFVNLIKQKQVHPTDLQSLIAKLRGVHSAYYLPLFEASITREKTMKAVDIKPYNMMGVIIGNIEYGNEEALQQELRPLIELVAKRLNEQSSSLNEYRQAETMLLDASDERLAYLQDISAGVSAYKNQLELVAQSNRLRHKIVERLKKPF
jgi:hypothetical protein